MFCINSTVGKLIPSASNLRQLEYWDIYIFNINFAFGRLMHSALLYYFESINRHRSQALVDFGTVSNESHAQQPGVTWHFECGRAWPTKKISG